MNELQHQRDEKRLRTIAITGGPCAGKTSALEALRAQLGRQGVKAVFVAEAATDLIMSGVAPWTCDSMLQFQTQVIKLQLEREAAARREAQGKGAGAMICDRGICDSHAYLSDLDYQRVLAANGLTDAQAVLRYDAVFHLETISKSDPALYADNNNARFENAQEAIDADDRTFAAWAAHPNLQLIRNEPDFADKVAKLARAIMQVPSSRKQSQSV